ncbi:MAG: hypothetical protein PQJ46_09400 [Spirochaetales bacterium]|nr:hypothetical protein [Spirochaetales bacterium]
MKKYKATFPNGKSAIVNEKIAEKLKKKAAHTVSEIKEVAAKPTGKTIPKIGAAK